VEKDAKLTWLITEGFQEELDKINAFLTSNAQPPNHRLLNLSAIK